MKISKFKIAFIGCLIFLIFETLPWVATIAESRNEKGQAESESCKRIREIILQLQSFGNRSTVAKQREVAQWITEAFRSNGADARILDIEDGSKQLPVVIARTSGRTHPNEAILLLAHLDSIADNPEGIAPGADDNASGIAVLLEIARALSTVDNARTVMYCIFPEEERGLAGSKAYARKARSESMDIKAIINVDVVGYNRPAGPLYYDALFSHATVKHKAKALWRMQRNYFIGFIEGRDAIKVAGRPQDEALVRSVAGQLQKSGLLKIMPTVDPGCG